MKDDRPQTSEQFMKKVDQSQMELDRRIFHLKTLYDVSQVIGFQRDIQQIMKNLLMMVMGTFGTRRGIILLIDVQVCSIKEIVQRSMNKISIDVLSQALKSGYFEEIKSIIDIQNPDENDANQITWKKIYDLLSSSDINIWIPFEVNENFKGGIGLGNKLSGDSYTPDDQELLSTIANQLSIAIDNASAYMEIQQLNLGLEAKVQERTEELRRQQEQLKEMNKRLEQHNRFIRATFGRYVSDEVVANLLDSPEGLQMGGQKRRITILVSDLRGFVALSERLAPEQTVAIVNRYVETMVDVIMRYQGTIQELMGDGLLILFGAPIWREDHAQRAVACAVAMQLAMAAVNTQNRQDGLPEVEIGIGIHTGEVVVGNIGAYKRTKYGAVGSPVNLTFRIESYTIGGQILISDATRQEAGLAVGIAEQIEIEAKGVEQPITLYDVRGIGGGYDLFLPAKEVALVPLYEEIPLQYTLLEGKYLGGTVFTGRLVRLSDRGAEIRSEHLVAPWSDIKMQLIDSNRQKISGDFYGKVVGESTEGTGGFLVCFTSLPPGVTTFLRGLLAAAAGSPLAGC